MDLSSVKMPIPGKASLLVLYKNCTSSMGIFKANGFQVLKVINERQLAEIII